MRIYGTVRNASTEKPIEGGTVSLLVGDGELAMLRTNARGEFDHGEAAEFIGETLRCSVEKKGYEPREVKYRIERDEVEVDIGLVKKKVDLELRPTLSPQWKKYVIGTTAVIILLAGVYYVLGMYHVLRGYLSFIRFLKSLR